MQPKIFKQSPKRAEPPKCFRKKNKSSEVAEQQIAQPAFSRIFAREPNCRDERRKREPAELFASRSLRETQPRRRRRRRPDRSSSRRRPGVIASRKSRA